MKTFRTLAVPVFNPIGMQPDKPIIIFLNLKEANDYMKAENHKRSIQGKKLLYCIDCTIEIPTQLDNYVSKNNQLKLF